MYLFYFTFISPPSPPLLFILSFFLTYSLPAGWRGKGTAGSGGTDRGTGSVWKGPGFINGWRRGFVLFIAVVFLLRRGEG